MGYQAVLAMVLWMSLSLSQAQHLVWHDTLKVFDLEDLAGQGMSPVRAVIFQRAEYALTLSAAYYAGRDEEYGANQFLALQDLLYRCRVETHRRFRFVQKFVHHVGVQYFFDSITRFQVDDNQSDSRLEWMIRKNHGVFISSLLCTRLFNGYDYSLNGSGQLVRTLNSSFLTPFTALFSGGFQFMWPSFGSLNMGITSAKLTWIRDISVYEAQQTTVYYGVPSDKRYLFEYGVSLQLLIDHEVTRWLHWTCDVLLFKKTDLPPDFSLKNDVGFRLTKFLKARIQTRIFYQERVSNKVQMENVVSVGLVVAL